MEEKWWEIVGKFMLFLIGFALLSQMCSGQPRCPEDPAYSYDPKTGQCIDLGEAMHEAYAEHQYQRYLDDQADMISEQAQEQYYNDLWQAWGGTP